ncbi:uracil-DNA glycosylase family protein [Neisseria wadsworthii]|uniref:Uracil-DNA glycosylase-like domain-containing protein n=1 Tax=Neisseria wadsworthii 9715 TaxID=1030841 RepID=G4CRR0_9NEIS|nr:uracil-DNA glycosylase family protein [Neisseria wadsworthii]EGZ45211.1 hypothetical protein HMPREF9370_1770 [Neisseria wadsworthii 9715]QMT35447.1 uracil-DNA glycosylase [Neisseria wadsworthii]
MLSSRYLHLHEALGLGPMWLKRGAVVLPVESEQAVAVDVRAAEKLAAPPEKQQQASAQEQKPLPPATEPASQVTAAPRRAAPTAPISGAHAATLASLGLKTLRQKEREAAADEAAQQAVPAEPQPDPDNTVARHKQRLSETVRPAKLMIVSICPSPEDNIAGRLFSGKVGELLANMLAAIGMDMQQTHPTSWLDATEFNPNPDTAKLARALPRIRAELELAEPQAVLFLGQFFTAPEQADMMDELCGGLPVFTVPHPARLLRHPLQKAEAWAELKRLREVLK